jgi:hypothetical protein
MRRLKTLLILAVLATTAAVPAAAQARTNVRVGIADQQIGMFDAPGYKSLKLKLTRYFIRWDARKDPASLAATDAYVRKARTRHVKVLLHISTNTFVKKKAHLPSVKEYKRDVGFLVRRYKKLGVKDWGTWNEENHVTQPTWKSPKRAAQFFKTMRGLCRGCHIVALDILDQAGSASYIKRFYKALGRSYARRYAKIVGIHNYSDTNRSSRRGSGTRSIIKRVKAYSHSRPQFWLTETGGVVNFGRSFPCNEKRAATAVSNMFKLAKSSRRDIKRLYVYNWSGASCNGFDTGLTRADGSLRPAYSTFKSRLKGFKR